MMMCSGRNAKHGNIRQLYKLRIDGHYKDMDYTYTAFRYESRRTPIFVVSYTEYTCETMDVDLY